MSKNKQTSVEVLTELLENCISKDKIDYDSIKKAEDISNESFKNK
jgi:hypothetical protein